jgi:protein-S-isoprenylcysteine O-methyltransferase Ste14
MSQAFFDYFQIICLVFFVFVFVGRTLYLRFCRNIRVFTLGVAKRGAQRVVELSFLFALAAWLVEIFLYTQPGGVRLFPGPFTMQIIDWVPIKLTGAALIVVGQIIFLLALLAFGDSWRVGIDKQAPGQLITGGIFAMTRNPIFVFMDLYLIGTFLINGTVIFLLFAALVVAGLHYQILQEETFLAQTYGKVYRSYCAQTRRYFGWRRGLVHKRNRDYVIHSDHSSETHP